MNLVQQIVTKLKKNKEFSKNFIWRTVQTFGKQGTSFLLFIMATSILGKNEMGIYNYVFSALYLLTIFADFGISTATSKYVAEYNVVDKEKLKKVFFNAFALIANISLIIIALTLLFGNKWFGESSKYLIYILPLVFFSPITSLYDGIYRGLKKFKEISIISLITGAISLIASYFLLNKYGLIGALLAQNFMYILYAVILGLRYTNWKAIVDKKVISDIGKYSLAFGIATLGYYLFSKVNVLILGQNNFIEEIATYELLNKVFTIYLLIFTILGQVLSPYVTEIFALKEYQKTKQLYVKSVSILSLISIAFVPITAFVTIFAIHLVFPQYDNNILRMLIFPVAITYAQLAFSAPINAGLIVATGHAGIMTYLNIVSGIVNVILNLFVVKEFGYIGVVWTTLVIQTISLIVLNIIYSRKLKKYV